jgi:hypothetical protein
MPDLQVMPECYADTILALLFIPNREIVVHIFGISNVAKEMQESADRHDNQTLVGLVDNDKRVPPYLSTFNTILEENRVIFKRNGVTNHYLIVVDKAIESFLIWNARQVNLALTDYGFTEDVKQFGKSLKATAVGGNENYLRLLTDLYIRQAPGLITLQRILHDFATN